VSKFALATLHLQQKGRKAMPTALTFCLLRVIASNISDGPSDFDSLGRQLIGGFALAIVVAVAFAILKLRWREQNPPAKFISISAPVDEAAPPKNVAD
jgi:hypothetical protein